MYYISAGQTSLLQVPEEGWFGQPKYSTQIYNLSTLYRFLLFYTLYNTRMNTDRMGHTVNFQTRKPIRRVSVSFSFPEPLTILADGGLARQTGGSFLIGYIVTKEI